MDKIMDKIKSMQRTCSRATVFIVRQSYCTRYSYRLDVRPPFRLSVCPSVRHTMVLCRNGLTYRQTVFTAW